MQINLPSSLRVIRNAKILKNLLEERGISFPLARCRDIVSQMLGFEGYNHLLQRMKPSGPAFWDEDQPRSVADERFRQYVVALIEADETNDDLYDIAHEVVRRLGLTRRQPPKGQYPLHSDIRLQWTRYDISTLTYHSSSVREFDPRKHKNFYLKRILEYQEFRAAAEYCNDLFHPMSDPLAEAILIGKKHQGKIDVVGCLCFKTVVDPENLHHMVEVLHYDTINDDGDGPYVDRDFVSAILRFILFEQFEQHLYEFWNGHADQHRPLQVTFSPQLADWPDAQTPLDLTLSLRGWYNDEEDEEDEEDTEKLFSEYQFRIVNEAHKHNALPHLGCLLMNDRESREEIFNALSILSHSTKERRLTFLEIDPVRRTQRVVFQDRYDSFQAAKREDFRSGLTFLGESEPWDILHNAIASGATAFLFDYCNGKPRLVVNAWFNRFIIDRIAYQIYETEWDKKGVKVERLEWKERARFDTDAAFFWLICFPRRLEAVIRSRKNSLST